MTCRPCICMQMWHLCRLWSLARIGFFLSNIEGEDKDGIRVTLLDNISPKLSLRLSKMKVRQVYEYDWGIHAIL